MFFIYKSSFFDFVYPNIANIVNNCNKNIDLYIQIVYTKYIQARFVKIVYPNIDSV